MSRLLKIYVPILIVTLAIFIVGCSSTKNTTDGDSNAKDVAVTNNSKEKSIMVYAGAGLCKPMEELGKMFQEKTGVEVQFTYGGTAQCISQILMVDKGDVFLPGDVEELKPLREKDKIVSEKPVVYHIPILAVPQGNPANIQSLNDLAKPGIKLVLGDAKANPIGKLSDKVLKSKNIFEQVEPNIVSRAATVNELFAYLSMKQVDASIIWKDNLISNEKIEMVQTAELNDYIKTVPIVLLKCSENPGIAAQFVDFVSSKEGIAVWEKWGFKPTVEAN